MSLTITMTVSQTHLRSSCKFLVAVMLTVRFGSILVSTNGSFFAFRTALNPANRASLVISKTGTGMTEEEKIDLHICHATDSLQYFCEGPEYDQFADKLDAFLANTTTHEMYRIRGHLWTSASQTHCWGKRRFPFPANTKILAVGNSHTRQILSGLMCQYEILQVFEPEFNEINSTASRRGTYYVIEFLNHAELHLVTNHALFYSRKWRQYLESTTKSKLECFDALIVGKINTYTLAYNTTFMALMLEKTAEFEEADFTTVAPPSLYDFARVYSGPIVAHSMMADYGEDSLNKEMIGFTKKANRTNIHFVNGRTYVPLLGECSSDHWNQVSDCGLKQSGHRCIGRRGGHPDLLAWDIIEAVFNNTNSCSLP